MFDPSLIFFAALAAFLCYRLYTVLGTKGGHEPEDNERMVPLGGKPAADDSPMDSAPPAPPANEPEWVKTVRAHFAGFDQKQFLEGAKSAYEMIVSAFAAGNLRDVQAFVGAPVLAAFHSAIEARQQANQTMEITFVGIEKADVLSAHEAGGEIFVTVAFQADQIRVTRDAEGNVVEGDPNRIDLVRDIWTFSRPVRSRDPNWTLAATDGAAQPSQ